MLESRLSEPPHERCRLVSVRHEPRTSTSHWWRAATRLIESIGHHRGTIRDGRGRNGPRADPYRSSRVLLVVSMATKFPPRARPVNTAPGRGNLGGPSPHDAGAATLERWIRAASARTRSLQIPRGRHASTVEIATSASCGALATISSRGRNRALDLTPVAPFAPNGGISSAIRDLREPCAFTPAASAGRSAEIA